MRIDGHRIVVTGASSGIGRAVMEELARRDAMVLGVARRAELIREHIGAMTGARARMEALAGDLSRKEDVDALFDEARRKWGGIDIFIANAGVPYYECIESADWERLAYIFRLNVYAVVYALEKLIEDGRGRDIHFVIVASGQSLLAIPGYSLYAATKAALERFVEAYRFEVPPGPGLTIVYPVATATNFFRVAGEGTPVPWPLQTAGHVARSIIRGIEKNRKRVYPSKLLRLTMAVNGLLLVGRGYQEVQARKFREWREGRRWPPSGGA